MGVAASTKKNSKAANQRSSYINHTLIDDEDAMDANDINLQTFQNQNDSPTAAREREQYSFANILPKNPGSSYEPDDRDEAGPSLAFREFSLPLKRQGSASPQTTSSSKSSTTGFARQTMSLPSLQASESLDTEASRSRRNSKLAFPASFQNEENNDGTSTSGRWLQPIAGTKQRHLGAESTPPRSPFATPPNLSRSASVMPAHSTSSSDNDSFPFKPEAAQSRRPNRVPRTNYSTTPSRGVARRKRKVDTEFSLQEQTTDRTPAHKAPRRLLRQKIIRPSPRKLPERSTDSSPEERFTGKQNRNKFMKRSRSDSPKRTPAKSSRRTRSMSPRRPKTKFAKGAQSESSGRSQGKALKRVAQDKAVEKPYTGLPQRWLSKPVRKSPNLVHRPPGRSLRKVPSSSFENSSLQSMKNSPKTRRGKSPKKTGQRSLMRSRQEPSTKRSNSPPEFIEESGSQHRRVTFQDPMVAEIESASRRVSKTRKSVKASSGKAERNFSLICVQCSGSVRKGKRQRKCNNCGKILCAYCTCSCDKQQSTQGNARGARESTSGRLRRTSSLSLSDKSSQVSGKYRCCRTCLRILYADNKTTRCGSCGQPLCQKCQCSCGGTTSRDNQRRASRKNVTAERNG